MKPILVSLLPLLAPIAPADDLAPPEPVTVAAICVEEESQRPMMGDPHGPPLLCQAMIAIRFTLKHGSCGGPCNTHVPEDLTAEPPGIPIGVAFTCPTGQRVLELSYRIEGEEEITLVDADSRKSAYVKSLEVEPFSRPGLAAACERALGGSWLSGGSHSNVAEKAETKLRKSIELRGQCSAESQPRQQKYQLSLGGLCLDRDFFSR